MHNPHKNIMIIRSGEPRGTRTPPGPRPNPRPARGALLRALNRHARDLTVRISLVMYGWYGLVGARVGLNVLDSAMPKGKTFPTALARKHNLFNSELEKFFASSAKKAFHSHW
jgi:hypothetical protein